MTAGPADPKALQVLPSWVTGNPVPPGSRIGKILQNEYLLKGLLGEGELGVTYEAENTRLRGRFAVLMLKRELKPTQGMMLQVRDDLRKAEPLAKLGLMPVRMVTDQHQIPGFATELLEGETLRRRLQRGPMRVERALAVALQVARALEALHQAGAVHGDLRPENLFLVKPAAKSSYAGRVVIVEHSFYHLRRREPGLDDKLPLYKLMYRPPELLLGERGPHPGADVFDLGAILYEAITGKPAFYDEDPDFILDNLGQPPKPLEPKPESGLGPELASQITVLITSACARDPDERLPDMGEFIAAIEQIVRGSGLKLPEVVVEAPEAAPEVQAAPSNQRMARVLERRSGVFAIIAPPGSPAPGPPAPASPPASSPQASPPGSSPQASTAASAAEPAGMKPTVPPIAPETDKPAATEPKPATPSSPEQRPGPPGLPATITAPKNKVTRILQRLSGAFPVLTISPDGTHIEESLSRPSDPQLKAPASAPPPPDEPAAPATSAASPATESAPAAATAPAPSEPAAAEPPPAPSAAPPATPAPAAAPAPAAEPSSVTPVPAAAAAPAPPTSTAPAASPTPAAASAPPAAAGPTAPAAPPRPAGIPADLARALLQSRQKSPQAPPGAEPASAASAPPAPPAVSPPPAASPPPAVVSAAAPVAAASAATSIAAASAATPIAAASAAMPIAAASAAAGDHPEAHKVTVPPVVPAFLESPAAAPRLPVEHAPSAAPVEAASSAPPAPDPGGHGALAPTPPVLPALSSRSREVTLAGDELIEAAEPPQPSTLSEVPTRPALAAVLPLPHSAPPPPVPITDVPLAAPALPPLLDQATQPALRRMPITEQATQARLPALDAISAQPTMAALSAKLSPLGTPPAPPAATPPPSPPPTAEGLPAPRPPRVSQLIKALQRGEMDAVKAITEAARSHAATAAVTPAPTASAAQPSVSSPSAAQPLISGPTPSAAPPSVPSASGPSQGRVSPGVMTAPPLLPASSSPEAAIATTQVDTGAKGLAPAETGLRELITRHQEALSMVAGAVLMLLIGLLALSLLR